MFGTGTLSLRLFSSAAFIAAAAVLWYALRRAFTLRATAVGVLAVFGTSWTVLWQNAETRFYGLFMLVAALAILATSTVMERRVVSRRLLVATAASHAALVWCHYFGLLYSGALFLALVLGDWRRRVVRPAIYASIAAAWLSFAPWMLPLARQAKVVTAQSWVAKPTLLDLVSGYQFQMLGIAAVLLLAALLPAIEAVFGVSQRQLQPRSRQGRSQAPMLLIALTLFAVPVVPFVVSRLWQSLFVDRYMLPTAAGWSIVLAFVVDACSAIDRSPAAVAAGDAPAAPVRAVPSVLRRTAGVAWAAFFAGLVAQPLYFSLRAMRVQRPFATHPWQAIERARLDGAPLDDLPVAVEYANEFMPLLHYSTRPKMPVFFIADSASAFDPTADRTAVIQYNGMMLSRRLGYFASNVVSSRDFLCSHARFLVLDHPRHHWFERNVQGNAAFVSRAVGLYHEDTLRVVERTAPPAVLGCPPGVPGP